MKVKLKDYNYSPKALVRKRNDEMKQAQIEFAQRKRAPWSLAGLLENGEYPLPRGATLPKVKK